MRKSQSQIDRKLLYIPRPQDWNWEKLPEREIADRLRLAGLTVERLAQWEASAKREVKEQQAKLWQLLPEAKLGVVQMQHAKVESAGKELHTIQRLKAQTTKAILDIHGNLSEMKRVLEDKT
jgi:hypothetical protein